MHRRILVTGASVAGNAAAWWLAEHGFDVTVVERATAFRDGGQNVDVRGAGREVLRRMGLEEVVRSRNTGEVATAWVDAGNGTLLEVEAHEQGFTAELEILRGDLARLLYEPARARAGYRFGDAVARVEQDDRGVTVGFVGGGVERYDLVVVAEGVGSGTRDMLFAGENHPRWINLTTAYFTIPKARTDDGRWRIYNATGGRQASIRPDPKGTSRANLVLQRRPGDERGLDPVRRKQFMRDRFADAGWELPRILDGLEEAEDFDFEVLRQVRMERYAAGRVVLTGDAAWCPTPLSGVGATLAIVGAYVLAGELSASVDHAEALAAYEKRMRAFVETGQSVPLILPRLMTPHSRFGLGALRGALRFVGATGLGRLAAKAIVRDAEAIALPDYPRQPSRTMASD